MKRGYNVILSLRYTTTVKIETEKEDEEKIKREAKDAFNIDVWDRGRLDDIIDGVQVVKIERNYSEQPKKELTEEERPKDYVVSFECRKTYLYVTVKANDKDEAIEKAEEDIITGFTSDDGNTDCAVEKYSLEDVELADWEKET